MWHRLAHARGCTVSELQARMSSVDFAEEIAWSNVEPWGEWRVIQLLATLCAMVANYMSAHAKGVRRTWNVWDFVPELRGEREEPPDDVSAFDFVVRKLRERGIPFTITKPEE